MFTEQLTQALAIPAAPLPPVNRANNATPYTVGPIDMSKYRRVMALVNAGVLTGAANIQAYFQTCSISNGTFANITNGNTVLLNTANTVCTLEIRSDQITGGDRYLQLAILVNANSAFCGAIVLGGEASYKPANAGDVGSGLTRVVASI